jgi:ADP-ribose pyrophosphatase
MSKPAGRWTVIESAITYKDRWLTLRSDRCLTAEGDEISPYHVLEYPDWINVVGFTRDDHRLLLVREYRHGRAEVFLGLVSGVIEKSDGETWAATETAARREVLEETGFTAGLFIPVLETYPNSANHSNKVTSFLALDLEPSDFRSFDPSESVELVLEDFSGVLTQLRDGTIKMQAMHVAALWTAAARLVAGIGIPESVEPLRVQLQSVFP